MAKFINKDGIYFLADEGTIQYDCLKADENYKLVEEKKTTTKKTTEAKEK
ncbi:MAG: hypothetical protein ACTJGH_00400 [Peptoniphilaceae bacterium]